MKRLSLLVAFMSSAMIYAQETTNLSLKDAIAYAEKNSPVMQNAHTDVAIAAQTVNTVKSSGLPQINASAGYSDYIQIPGSYVKNFLGGNPEYLFFRFQQKYAANATIGLNQLLFDGSFFIGLKAAEEYVSLSQSIEIKSLNDLHMAVARAYMLALTTAKNIDLVNSNLATLEKSLKDVTSLNEEGFAEKLDVQRLQLAVSNLKIQRDKLTNAVAITQNLLKLQIGMDINTSIQLTDNLETVNNAIPLAETVANSFDAKKRIEYQLLNQTLGLSYLDEKRYKYGYFPTLVGYLQHQETTNRSEFNFFKSNLTPNNDFIPSTIWGLSLNIPVFDGFRKHSQIMDVRLRRMKTENDLRNFENAANLEYNNAKLTYEVNLRQAEEVKLNMDLAKEIYEKANIKFNEGVGTTLEIVQAENDLKTAQTNYMNALYDLVISKMELKRASGEFILK